MVRVEDDSGAWFTLERAGLWMDELIVIEVKAGTRWFNGELNVALYPNEIGDLVEGLTRLHRDCAGAYRFQSQYENSLDITFAMGKRGDLAITLRLQNTPDFLHELRVVVNLDQSYLPTLIGGVRDIIAAS